MKEGIAIEIEGVIVESNKIGDIIAERIGQLAYENGEEINYIIEPICAKSGLKPFIVNSVIRGFDIYEIYGNAYNAAAPMPHTYIAGIRKIPPFEMLAVIKAAAEYFNTSTDFILGLTDKAY